MYPPLPHSSLPPSYALKDELGEVRPIEVDQHCRNYIFLSKDLCILPYLNLYLRSKVESLRIKLQCYADDVVGLAIEAYRWHMDYLAGNPGRAAPRQVTEDLLLCQWFGGQ
mgnify:CR=1 FL=1